MHSANLIHRDLKPANILIDSNCQVKICDFGISRSFEDDSQTGKDTLEMVQKETPKKLSRKMSALVMTRWYRSPEVILMEKYNTKADMWSIGCIFAEILKITTNYKKAEVPSSCGAVLFQGGSCYPISPY